MSAFSSQARARAHVHAHAHAPHAPSDFDVTDEVDAQINALALQARTDPAARDALYATLGLKIERFVRRCCYRRGITAETLCQPDDVAQEAFLVLIELIEQWPGGDSFTGFFLSVFPRRLSRAVAVLQRGCTLSPESQRQILESLVRDDLELASEDDVLLAEVQDSLSPRERIVLALHIGQGLTHQEIARLLGLHIRSVARIWQQILDTLRLTWPQPSVRARLDRAAPRCRNRQGTSPPLPLP